MKTKPIIMDDDDVIKKEIQSFKQKVLDILNNHITIVRDCDGCDDCCCCDCGNTRYIVESVIEKIQKI